MQFPFLVLVFFLLHHVSSASLGSQKWQIRECRETDCECKRKYNWFKTLYCLQFCTVICSCPKCVTLVPKWLSRQLRFCTLPQSLCADVNYWIQCKSSDTLGALAWGPHHSTEKKLLSPDISSELRPGRCWTLRHLTNRSPWALN